MTDIRKTVSEVVAKPLSSVVDSVSSVRERVGSTRSISRPDDSEEYFVETDDRKPRSETDSAPRSADRKRHVLVAMGSSGSSATALRYALKEFPDAKISVLHVIETSDPLDLFDGLEPSEYMVPDCESDLDERLIADPDMFKRSQRKRAERVFDRACAIADAHGATIDPVVEAGRAEREIIRHGEEKNADRIVIAEHERTELRPPLLRSVPESVVKHSSIPVIVVQNSR